MQKYNDGIDWRIGCSKLELPFREMVTYGCEAMGLPHPYQRVWWSIVSSFEGLILKITRDESSKLFTFMRKATLRIRRKLFSLKRWEKMPS